MAFHTEFSHASLACRAHCAMGVRLLAHTQASSEGLDKRLEQLNCKFAAKWQIRCTFLRPNPKVQQPGLADMFTLQGTEQPHLIYMLSQNVLLVAGQEIAGVIEEMDTHVKKLRVSVDGSAHECGDFIVRVGKLYLNNQLQGTVVEVEFKPCSVAGEGIEPLREFVGMLLPENVDIRVGAGRDFMSSETCFELARDLPKHFSPQHSVCQFVSLMRGSTSCPPARSSLAKDTRAVHVA